MNQPPSKTFDPRELRRALLGKLALVMREESMAEANAPPETPQWKQPELLAFLNACSQQARYVA